MITDGPVPDLKASHSETGIPHTRDLNIISPKRQKLDLAASKTGGDFKIGLIHEGRKTYRQKLTHQQIANLQKVEPILQLGVRPTALLPCFSIATSPSSNSRSLTEATAPIPAGSNNADSSSSSSSSGSSSSSTSTSMTRY